MTQEKIERIENLVRACNVIADDQVFTCRVSEIYQDSYEIEITCKNTAYRQELRTLINLIDMLHPTLDESPSFISLH